MLTRRLRARARLQLLLAALVGFSGVSIHAVAQSSPSFSGPSGIPPQIIPLYGRSGPTGGSSGGGANTYTGGANGAPTAGAGSIDPGASATYPASGTIDSPTNTPELQTFSQQSYGATGISAAESLSENPASLAAIAKAESNFQNVPTANGSSSATGEFQFTRGTFVDVSNSNGLGYTAVDLTNPDAQAVVAPYYLQQIASTISASTGQPATTLQAYGGWVFGPDAGTQIAAANDNAPLNTFVSAKALANNGMQNWTVGQFRQTETGHLGAAANQTVMLDTGA